MRKIITFLAILFSINIYAQKLDIYDLKTNYFSNPMGINTLKPRISWKLSPDSTLRNILQTHYRVQVATDTSNMINSSYLIWDTQKSISEQSTNILFDGNKLSSKTRYYWRVKVWDNHQRVSEWSPFSFFETAFFDTTEWKAKWIEPDLAEEDNTDNPSPCLRREFELKKEVKKARLYITSHGLYEAYINGEKVTDHLFTPGWTSYNKRLQYQVYDVTKLLKKGENATGVILGDGWYKGRLRNKSNHYGTKIGLLYQLEIEYIDATSEIIVSDKAWKTTYGPIRISSIYDGELYDANKELGNWTEKGYNDKAWIKVVERQHSLSNLIPNEGIPVKIIQELKVQRKLITPNNELVFDFGQNLTGVIRFNLRGRKGDTITIYHAEVLDKEGNFYTDNLRSAKQKVQYVFSDNSEITYNPLFTFQGFRYIKIESPSGEINPQDFKALVIHSEMTPAGNFHCSDSLVNQLYSNIIWSQKGNFLDIPTDCPQRDERLGWTGDAQVFASTAIYNYDVATFFLKWLNDLKADQTKDGSVPRIIPDVYSKNSLGSTGWGDAATIIPYKLYLKYGDKRFLENQYESMKAWVRFLNSLSGNDLIVDKGFHYGDWLFFIDPTHWNTKPGYTDLDLIATAFFAYSVSLCRNAAEILGFKDDADSFNLLYKNIKKVFQKEYLTATGRLSSNSQTAYILALEFNLIPDSLKTKAVEYLVKNIKSRKYHLSTGFLGTPYICKVLTENGFEDVAYKLLLQKDYPSWLYPVTKGATTIWERWDGIKPDGSFQTTRMNSFNHYAYGAIGSWLYEYVAGIQTSKEAPGYKNIVIHPYVDSSLSNVKFSYESVYGLISSEWKIRDGKFHFSVIVPSNTKATIILPYKNERYEVGSGKYVYEYDINPE